VIPSAYADGTDCAGWAALSPHPRPFSQWEKGEQEVVIKLNPGG